MVDTLKQPGLVGQFIRRRREALHLSQRALGLLFTPAVTTQFISNVERGVTPLPPSHVPTLTQALQITENELLTLMEQEYTLKLSHRLGKKNQPSGTITQAAVPDGHFPLPIVHTDFNFMKKLYDAFSKADAKTKTTFLTVCESIFNLSK